ncbi:AsmA family protein [Methylobacterium nonmethylotrophicum]|uniref:AsmA family protein n=1 Tax=Methylobacterium nonmethylotrophicum TaxID=1141884 RepID=A0A4Z0NSC7_9HYPH|nr:AsmA-like C-terminal region-containing protein [Methylobacterium nonmethylotrophicum]TGD98937.1 AsmA family protein [Methylobacterium nonmethylotrophicum]
MRLRNLLLILATAAAAGVTALLIAGEALVARAAADRLEAATGRPWTVGGAGLSLEPLGVTLRDLATETDLGSAGRARLTIEAVRLGGTASGLLAGEVEEAELVRPALLWPAQWWRGAEAARGGSPPPARPPLPRRITVRDGSLALTEGERVVAALEALEATAEPRGDGHAVTVAGRGAGLQGTCDLTVAPALAAASPPGEAAPVAVAFTCRAPQLAGAPLTGTADAALAGPALSLSRLAGSLGPDRFGGSVVVDLAQKPFVRLDLGFDALSLAAPSGAGAVPDVAMLRLFDGRVRLRAGSLAVGQTRLGEADLDLRLTEGAVEATLAPAALQGGQVRGRLATTVPAAAGDVPRHALQLELTRARALPLLSGLAGFTLLDGTASASLDLRSMGRDLDGIRRGLSGKASLLVENGRLVGIDIPGVVQSMAAQVSSADTTSFDRLSLRFDLQDGRAATQELALAGPLVTAGGSGVVDLTAQRIAFRIEPRLTRAAARNLPRILDVSLPVLINGPWDAPQIQVDLAGLMGDGKLSRELGAVGGGLLGGRNGGGLGGLLDALMPADGGGRPGAPRGRPRP